MPNADVKVLNPKDNVGTLVKDSQSRAEVAADLGEESKTIILNEDIEYGHKIALSEIKKGDLVRKYGRPIGKASQDIKPGDWVHTHNVSSEYGRGDRTER